jgi:predicted Zn-dependent peptidase
MRKGLFYLWLSGCVAVLVSSGLFCGEAESPWKYVVHKEALQNGLTLICEKDDSSPLTYLQIVIKGGRRADPRGLEGLSYLVSRLSVEVPDSSQVQKLMVQASQIGLTSREDYSAITLECLTENLEESVKMLSRIMGDPLFSGLRIDNIKDYMRHQAKLEQDDSIIVGHLAALGAFFAGAGYGFSAYGTEEALKAIKKKDITSFYDAFFVPSNITVVASSDLESDKLAGILKKYLGSLRAGKAPEPVPVKTSSPAQKTIFIEKDKKQSYVAWAFPLPKISRRDYALAVLLENLLGRGQESRLWPLRSEERLAYNVNSRASLMQESGLLEAYLETDVSKTDKALESLKKIIQRLFEAGINDEEFKATKAMTKANFLRQIEAKIGRVQTFSFFEALGFGQEYLESFFSEVDEISLDEMNAYIKRSLDPEKGIAVIVGRKTAL